MLYGQNIMSYLLFPLKEITGLQFFQFSYCLSRRDEEGFQHVLIQIHERFLEMKIREIPDVNLRHFRFHSPTHTAS